MKLRQSLLGLLLFTAFSVGIAADPIPVVLPVECSGSDFRTSKFGDGYITRGANGQTYTTTRFGDGWITRGPDGKSWTTSKFGDGTITRGPDGQSITTSKFGSGTISRESDGTSFTTQEFGNGTISRASEGTPDTRFCEKFFDPLRGFPFSVACLADLSSTRQAKGKRDKD